VSVDKFKFVHLYCKAFFNKHQKPTKILSAELSAEFCRTRLKACKTNEKI